MTDRAKLDELLEAARNHEMTEEELKAQRESWVRGEMAIGSDADEIEYRAHIIEGSDTNMLVSNYEAEALITMRENQGVYEEIEHRDRMDRWDRVGALIGWAVLVVLAAAGVYLILELVW